ncbi:MAG: nucleotidyltransferase family protein [Terriglobales bacterium]
MASVAMHDVMQTDRSIPARDLHLLSHLLLGEPFARCSGESGMLPNWGHDELARFLAFADRHHVLVRAVEALQSSTLHEMSPRLSSQCATVLAKEQDRVRRALKVLDTVCEALESAECPAIVIKSLDHWPDIGSDLDLYTGGRQDQVVSILERNFAAEVLPRSWGDRLAHKWNFSLPGLAEAVEVHVGCLGQTGEHLNLALRLERRAVRKTLGGYTFRVPAPEERVLITTLQRMYRHFYYRLCDIVDTTKLIQAQELDYTILRTAAESSGIWPGVGSLLTAVAEFAHAYGAKLELPAEVVSSATKGGALELRGDFLRISIMPQAVGLFLRQVVCAGTQKNFRTVSRLSLLPGLAAAAFVAYKVTGNDKGIW